jgi:adsorption protein B
MGNQPAWDKTEHHFPGRHLLVPYRKRLGDLLMDNELISEGQLQQAIIEQQKTGQRLGQVLCQLNLVTHAEILRILSEQYNLPLFPQHQIHEAIKRCLPLVPNKTIQWLYKHDVSLIDVDEANRTLTVAIEDPTNELLLGKIINYVMPYKTQFMLIEINEI